MGGGAPEREAGDQGARELRAGPVLAEEVRPSRAQDPLVCEQSGNSTMQSGMNPAGARPLGAAPGSEQGDDERPIDQEHQHQSESNPLPAVTGSGTASERLREEQRPTTSVVAEQLPRVAVNGEGRQSDGESVLALRDVGHRRLPGLSGPRFERIFSGMRRRNRLTWCRI